MITEPVLVTETLHSLILTLHRPLHRNSIDQHLLIAIHHAIDRAEQNPHCRFIILQGENGLFCTGMDFKEVMESSDATTKNGSLPNAYLTLLKRFTTTSKVIISLVDGQVLAGGVGIVAASDLVLSTSRSQFSLPEALWGLLPACVLPFLIRRIGFQKAYFMTLTTQTLNAKEAKEIGLIDELTENLNDSLYRLQLRINRLAEETIKDIKSYFIKLQTITEEMENTAMNELHRLLKKAQVQTNIKNFVECQKLPWQVDERERC